MNKIQYNIKKEQPLFIIHYTLFIILILNCTKSPTNSDNTNQVTVNTAITQNTTWTSGIDYIVEGTVTVQKGASLNITGEVTVLFKADQQGTAGKLRIDGSLQAKGTDSTSAVLFKPYDATVSDGAWGIELNQSEGCGVFEFCRFEGLTYGVNAFEASVLVNECTFVECVNGVLVTKCDSALIQGSEFLDNEYGVKTNLSPVGEDSVRVIRNVFSGASEVGVEVNNFSKAFVNNNYFNNCEIGLLNINYSKCMINYNNFENCELCCQWTKSNQGIIQNNDFKSGNNAIKVYEANVIICHNNIIEFNNYKIIYKNINKKDTLIARYNWWNSIKNDEINLFIWDGKDNNDDKWEGVVDFVPYIKEKIIF